MSEVLHDVLARSAAERGDHPAVEEASGAQVDYRELQRLADRVRDRLQALGVAPGDRVGVYARKSIDTVASILGVLQCGAAYVPVDPGAPAVRNGYIFANCAVRAVIVEDRFAAGLSAELERVGHRAAFVELGPVGGGNGLRQALDDGAAHAPAGTTVRAGPDDLAYILYTSGSTGNPKGVMLSHRNATSFVDWCTEALDPRPSDRFSAHAPFHFDLSILDLYVSMRHGATLVLIGEDLGKDPTGLARFIAERGITVWYSAPSILTLLVQRGQLEQYDYARLRTVLFAGEVFPVPHLRALQKQWPHPAYFNLYGPTETNVCTYHPIPAHIPDERVDPYPIGKVCSHLRDLVVDADGTPIAADVEGELCIAGPAVMRGYWNDPAQTASRFIEAQGAHWYRTGDLVRRDQAGDWVYVGRRDRMVKKRGYRVELGEIEACLARYAEVLEVAVVAIPDEEAGLLVRAHLATEGGKRLSAIKLKQFCSEHLPVYMVPDQFDFRASLPKTSTGKMDYRTLAG